MREISKAALSAIVLAGCGGELFGPGSSELRPNDYSGARLTVSLTDDNDVVGFHFEVDAVECEAGEAFDEFHYEETVALDDVSFPGRIEFLEWAPFDSDSSHVGADFFVALDPGCYVVTATPVSEITDKGYTESDDCSTATSDPLEVVGGYTTETVLLSQCEGELVGAIDALVVTNTPPTVVPDIENKFNNQCEEVVICAKAWDPDDDPVEFEFINISEKGRDFFSISYGDVELVGYEGGNKLWEQCATIVTEGLGSYHVEIRAYDQAYDDSGTLVRFEDYTGEDSHGWIQVPIHTGWKQSDTCIEDDGSYTSTYGSYEGTGDGDPATCDVISDEEYYCSGTYDVDPVVVDFLCDGTDLRGEELYDECAP
jgi:hypothetical protein